MPTLNDLGDSAHIVGILSRGANPRARLTSAELRFGRNGKLRKTDVTGAGSSKARDEIRDSLRTLLNPLGALPIDFTIHLVRFNNTGQTRILAETTTCRPESHATTEMQSLILRIRQQSPGTRVHRDVVVRFILEADGEVGDAWVEFSSTYPQVDELAIDIVRAQRFEPGIVGNTPVAVFAQQSVRF